jgi:hypothetical protein
MKIIDIGDLPKFFDRYILLVEDYDLIEGLKKFSPENVFKEKDKLEAVGDKVYAPGKWTIKEILQHCIDTERIMAYRALCFARNDENILPGFDEQVYADNTNLENKSIHSLIEEFTYLRKSNILMFEGFNKTMFLRKGTANLTRISPLALGFVIIGHLLHHYNIIEERYFKLIKN